MCALYSAGSNACGQLAHGSNEDSHIFKQCIFDGIDADELAGSTILSIAAGANHTLLLLRSSLRDNRLWACGNGQRGQLGARFRRDFGASPVFRRISLDLDKDQYSESELHEADITLIAASWESSFVVLSVPDKDVLLSVGSDDFGDLGIGGLSSRVKETDVWHSVSFDHLLPKNASDVRISQLKAGPHTVLAAVRYQDANTREIQLIVGWGAARQGQLGQGPASVKGQAIFTRPRILEIPSHIDAFAIGNQHAVFLTSEGTNFALGSDKKGQLRGIDSVKNISAVDATWNGTYLIKKHESANKWSVLATGSNLHGQLALKIVGDGKPATTPLHEIALPPEISAAKSLAITCGSEHVLLTAQSDTQNGAHIQIFAWGWNEHGNLGLGHSVDVDTPTRIWPSADLTRRGRVAGVWAGCATSWIATEKAELQ